MADGRMWSTTDNARWFYVPNEIGIPAGGLEVRDLLGRRKGMDADALRVFEVTGDAAKTLVRRQMLDLLSQADAGLESLRSLVPPERPEGGAGLDVMRKVVAGIVTGLRTQEDPPPRTYAPENLAARFEGWLRGVAEDPSKVEGLTRFTDELHAMARQLDPAPMVAAVRPGAPPPRPAPAPARAPRAEAPVAPAPAEPPAAAEAPARPTAEARAPEASPEAKAPEAKTPEAKAPEAKAAKAKAAKAKAAKAEAPKAEAPKAKAPKATAPKAKGKATKA